MKDMEILCRASAFLVKAKNKTFHSKYHLLTVGHAVAPWRWPKHYPDEWLQQVNERHTLYTVEMRHADGLFMSQSELDSDVYHHPTRDFSVLHLQDEDSVFETLRGVGVEDTVHNMPALSRGIPEFLLDGAKLVFHGHEVANGSENSPTDDRRCLPRTVPGAIIGRTPHQIFSRTTPTLVDGMCGGPVLFDGWNGTNKSSEGSEKHMGQTVGMVEGIVPLDHPDLHLRGAAVFVETDQIRRFLDRIESGEEQPVRGGQIASSVGSDQDPSKMDMNKFL